MTDAIAHRGPDEDGHRTAPGIALGMRRLSIIDLAGSHQPLGNEDGTVWTVFNGEIFNFRELRADLIARGHRFATEGDTETIVHLYEEHGRDFARHLRGMFGIAVWDGRRQELVLARDRLGVKPLYYAVEGDRLLFASEAKSLFAGKLLEARLDPMAAELFLAFGYVPGPRTLFEGVRKLPPATTLVWRSGQIDGPAEYWDPWTEAPERAGTWEDDQEQLLELLRDAVRARLISDVPLGVMLSGGLDSSLITALMAEASTGPVETFAVGFSEDGDSNELGDARLVASALGTNHHEVLTSATELPGLLDTGLWHLEEPIVDLSFLGFLLLSRFAREHVTVALCGQAADELLGGYTKHGVARLAGHAVPGRSALRAVAGALPEGSRAARLLGAVGATDPAERLLAMSRVTQPRARSRLLTPAAQQPGAEREIHDTVSALVPDVALSPLGQTLALDQRLALPDLMFTYFDKMSMAASLEVRVPFADHHLVSFCMALPDDRKILRGRRKEILRRVARGLVPDHVIEKRKRAFFRNAAGSWLDAQGDLVRDVLLDPATLARGIFEPAELEAMLDAGPGDGRSGETLLAPLMLELWLRRFVDAG